MVFYHVFVYTVYVLSVWFISCITAYSLADTVTIAGVQYNKLVHCIFTSLAAITILIVIVHIIIRLALKSNCND